MQLIGPRIEFPDSEIDSESLFTFEAFGPRSIDEPVCYRYHEASTRIITPTAPVPASHSQSPDLLTSISIALVEKRLWLEHSFP
jgi:hypothetical protein